MRIGVSLSSFVPYLILLGAGLLILNRPLIAGAIGYAAVQTLAHFIFPLIVRRNERKRGVL
jgi:hypothetical protein